MKKLLKTEHTKRYKSVAWNHPVLGNIDDELVPHIVESPLQTQAHSHGEIRKLVVETSLTLSALGSSVHWKTLLQGHTWEQNKPVK